MSIHSKQSIKLKSSNWLIRRYNFGVRWQVNCILSKDVHLWIAFSIGRTKWIKLGTTSRCVIRSRLRGLSGIPQNHTQRKLYVCWNAAPYHVLIEIISVAFLKSHSFICLQMVLEFSTVWFSVGQKAGLQAYHTHWLWGPGKIRNMCPPSACERLSTFTQGFLFRGSVQKNRPSGRNRAGYYDQKPATFNFWDNVKLQ